MTKTHCLGICPEEGATVARYPSAEPIVSDVGLDDVAALLEQGQGDDGAWEAVERELMNIEELQTSKVLDLARRLKPGLTLEDVQNPHDFPELNDPDWHYADGVLAGIASVRTALAAREQDDHGQEEDPEGT